MCKNKVVVFIFMRFSISHDEWILGNWIWTVFFIFFSFNQVVLSTVKSVSKAGVHSKWNHDDDSDRRELHHDVLWQIQEDYFGGSQRVRQSLQEEYEMNLVVLHHLWYKLCFSQMRLYKIAI